MEDLTGKQFGHYQIVAPLGEGGMAAVYKAYQPSMERYVAIKVLPRHMASSEEFRNRFKREAKLLAHLQHPHILPVFDYGEEDGYPYIVMPFVPSGTLSGNIHDHQLSLQEITRFMNQIGGALAHAHAHGMIHRDVKPSNVLIDESGNCLLTDFGLARMTEASIKITSSGAIMGTPAYMSPEQGAGSDVDHRSDIYSLGIILYEMVTGRVPYTAETPIAVVVKHIQDPLPSARKLRPDLPEAVELVILKALAKKPEDRYQSADAFVHALQAATGEGAIKTTMASHPQAAPAAEATQVGAPPTARVALKKDLKIEPRRSPLPKYMLAGFLVVLVLAGGLWGVSVVVRAVTSGRNQATTTGNEPSAMVSTKAAAPVAMKTATLRPTASPIPSPTEFPAVITDAKDVTMVLIPAGEFSMGNTSEQALAECRRLFPNNSATNCKEEYFADETPPHTVYLDSYYIDKYEVTNRLYEACVNAGICRPPSKVASETHGSYYGAAEYQEHPVIWVDWNMARTYCEWRGARLPSEAEWEKAARGSFTQNYPWGDAFDSSKTNSCDANCPKKFADKNNNDGFVEIAPVTAFMEGASVYGIFNLAGNVSEWVADWYAEDYYTTLGEKAANPQGPQSGEMHVIRGGSWARYPINLRLVTRSKNDSGFSANDLGFRCAVSLP